MLVFISYAHGDVITAAPERNWLSLIKTFFEPAVREGTFDLWWDESIRPGQQWDSNIKAKLDQASVAIILVSPRYLASEYVARVEIPRLLTRKSEGKMEIIPLILETCDLGAKFNYVDTHRGPCLGSIGNLQSCNHPSEPLITVTDKNAINHIFMSILTQIRELAKGTSSATSSRQLGRKPSALIRILVAGSGIPQNINDAQRGVSHALGAELARKGFGMITGGWEGVDEIATKAFIAELRRQYRLPHNLLTQVVRKGWDPPIDAGEMIFVDPGNSEWVEQIVRSDAIVLIGGLGGTWTTGELGYAYGKLVLPLADTGDDAQRFYDEKIANWDQCPIRGIDLGDFKRLSRTTPSVLDDVFEILGHIED